MNTRILVAKALLKTAKAITATSTISLLQANNIVEKNGLFMGVRKLSQMLGKKNVTLGYFGASEFISILIDGSCTDRHLPILITEKESGPVSSYVRGVLPRLKERKSF